MTALETFNACYKTAPQQGPVGHTPATYILAAATILQHGHPGYKAIRDAANRLLEGEAPHHGLTLHAQLDRSMLLELCQTPGVDSTVAFCCCMAWGLQWSMPGGFENFKSALVNPRLAQNLDLLRKPGSLEGAPPWTDRRGAFVLFDDADSGITNLGKSYFTKLIFFLLRTRDGQKPGYIQDKWTEKSYQVLQGHFPEYRTVSRRGDGAAGRYEDFCRFVDYLAESKKWTGSETETALFGASAEWRRYLENQNP